jgi:ABC-type Fe3+ transport system substrate-binding protein
VTTKGMLLAASLIWAAAGAQAAMTPEEVGVYTGADRAKVLLDGAHKEGELSWYTVLIVDQAARPMAEEFQKRYPGIKVNFTRQDGAQLLQRVMAENRAGAVRGDVVVTGEGEAYKRSGFAIPFISPMQAAYPPDYIEKGRLWSAYAVSWQGIAWNTNLVKDSEAPKSFEDLLDPKWKGKMAWSNGVSTGAPGMITYLRMNWGEERTIAYLEKLKEQGIRTLPGSIRTVMDQVIAGEAPVGVAMAMHHAAISRAAGAPINASSPAPVWTRIGTVHLLKGAPHPNAAMLFIDYVLDAKGGQEILNKALYGPAHPDVVQPEHMRWIQPSKLGKKEFVMDLVEEDDMRPVSMDLYQKYFR